MPEMMTNATGWYNSTLASDLVADSQGRQTPGVVGRFRKHRVLDTAASREADEEVWKVVVICEEKVKGQDDVSAKHLRADNWKDLTAKYRDGWAAFEGEALEVTGIPLEKLELAPEKIMSMWCEGIRSIEDLAELPDPVCERLGFGTKSLRTKAAEYLKGLGAQEPKKPAVLKGKTRDLVMGSTAQTPVA